MNNNTNGLVSKDLVKENFKKFVDACWSFDDDEPVAHINLGLVNIYAEFSASSGGYSGWLVIDKVKILYYSGLEQKEVKEKIEDDIVRHFIKLLEQ